MTPEQKRSPALGGIDDQCRFCFPFAKKLDRVSGDYRWVSLWFLCLPLALCLVPCVPVSDSRVARMVVTGLVFPDLQTHVVWAESV